MPKGNFISQLIAAYPKMRPFIALALVIAVSLSPAIPDKNYKLAVTTALVITLVFLIFDVYKELLGRLALIEGHLKEPEPPTYDNYTESLPYMEKVITSYLSASANVQIRMLTVSAQFSWKNLIEDRIDKFLELGGRDTTINIELIVTQPNVLDHWEQEKLKMDAYRTLTGIELFNQKYADVMKNGKLSLDVFLYDNIPHWHGILINNNTLFMGRARWIIKGNKYDLTVGTNEYRMFQKGDRFRGTERVLLFENWFEAYKLRSKYLAKQQ